MKVFLFCLIAFATSLHGVPKITVTLAPIYSIVCGVAGFKPTLIMQPGASHHDYNPSLKDVTAIKEADLFVWVAPGLETFVPKLLQKFHTRNVQFGAVPNITKISECKCEHDHGDYDPHLWLDPQNCILLAKQVAKELIAIDPANRTTYEKNLKVAIEKLNKLNDEMTSKLAPLGKTNFIVYHDGFGYIVNKFKLKQVGVLKTHPEYSMSIEQYEKIVHLIAAQNVKTLFIEPQYNDTINQKIAKQTGVRLVSIDSMGINRFSDDLDYYINMMHDILKSFESGLKN